MELLAQNNEGIVEKIQTNFFKLQEVVESIFQFMNHAELKLCRQVNKAWNAEACRFLRKRSLVHLNEYQRLKLDDFVRLLDGNIFKNNTRNDNNESQPHSKSSNSNLPLLPLPFRLYSLEAEYFQDESLMRIISDERLSPLKLTFYRPPFAGNAVFPMRLHHLLVKNGRFLEHVHFTLCKGTLLGYRSTENKNKSDFDIILPKLTAIELSESWTTSSPGQFKIYTDDKNNDNDHDDEFSFSENENKQIEIEQENNFELISAPDFLVKLINAAPNLQKIVSNLSEEKSLLQILCNANLKNLSHFSASYLTPCIFEKLQTLPLPKLKVLRALIDPDLLEEEFVGSQVMHYVVSHLSSSLEKLYVSWNFNSANNFFPFCPKLKVLAIKYWSGSLGAFNSQRLPALRRIHVFDCVNELTTSGDENNLLNILNPHDGVDTFVFECMKGTGVRFGLYSDEDFARVFTNVAEQFPNVTCLDLNLALTVKSLRTIIQNFPKLVKLILDSDNEYTESVFTGIGQKNLKNILNSGCGRVVDLNKVPKLASFMDLKCLQHLVLSRSYEYRFPYDVALTENSIRYGLSKIPKLTILQFDWEGDISAKIIQEELSHLSKIIINSTQDIMYGKEEKELELVQNAMQQVEINVTDSHFIGQVCSRLRRSSTRRPLYRRNHQQNLNRLSPAL